MRKLYLVLVFLFYQMMVAQVGINTTTPNAQLDVRSSNQATPSNTDGMLIPNIDTFPVSSPTVAQQGMLVYLTTVSGLNQPGYYYWDNPTLTWISFGNNNNNWKTTGNAGTTATTNFIGTTDNVDLIFKRNNLKAGLISSSNTSFGSSSLFSNTTGFNNSAFGTSVLGSNTDGHSNSAFGFSSLRSNTTGDQNSAFGIFSMDSNTTGIQNSAFGITALRLNTIGSSNSAFGGFTLESNTTGSSNSAFGINSMSSNTTGNNNSASGANALRLNTTGSGNTAFGRLSLTSNITGSENTALGNNANVSVNNLTNATAIGANAQVGTSNSMVLGSINGVNNATASTSVAIGTTIPKGALDVTSSVNGILIPRVALTSTIVQAPIVNPQTGVLEISTLIYNTATAGVNPSNVYPGFYYWNGLKWIRFDVDGENNSKYYTAVGTTNVAIPSSFVLAPEMTITFTPNDSKVIINFSANGFGIANSCGESGVFFQLLLNGVPITGWQSTAETPSNTSSNIRPIWNCNINIPINVTQGISQTISVNWGSPSCSQLGSLVSIPTPAAPGFDYRANRILTVIDPNGGGGIVGTPPNTTNLWSHTGNAGTNSATNFVGTTDAQPLVLKSNNVEGLRIATNGNVGLGIPTPTEKLHVVGNIRMVDGNQAIGRVLTSDASGTAAWQNASDNAWGLTGNSGTTAATNFVGTIDNVDLVFKRFNIRGGIIGTTNTSLGLNALNPASTGTSNTAIGSGSLDINSTGSENMAAGLNTLTSNTTGTSNTAIGVAAMVTNTSGNLNTAIGRSALFDNTTGSNNTATGYNSLSNVSTGINNTAVGSNSFSGINAGNNNTALGADTSLTSTILDNATAIGYKATAGNSNTMVLGSINGVNGATSSVNVGIGTISPQTTLEVVDTNVVTSATAEGIVNIISNGPQTIDSGGSITLGGNTTDAGTTARTFGSIEGRKASGTTSVSSGYLLFKTNNAGTLSERMRITNAGDVGIGTATPGGQLELSLNEGRKPTSNTWTIPSDARLKEINGNYEKGLTEILKLKPIRYHYKNTDKRTFEQKVLDKEAYGFLAQDVQLIFPEAVATDADGYLNFDLHPILIASVNALKELNEKNVALQTQNEALKNELEILKQKVDAIVLDIEKLKK